MDISGRGIYSDISSKAKGAKYAVSRDLPKRKKVRKTYRKAPATLPFATIVAMLMSAMYFYRVFSFIPVAIEEDDTTLLVTAFALMLLFFLMFVRFIIALFRLSSGSRKAWVTTVRMAGSYILLTVLGFLGLEVLSTDINFGVFAIPSWVMSVVMIVLIAYMLLPNIRDYFTPTYADKVGLSSWVGYIFGRDPFAGKRLVV